MLLIIFNNLSFVFSRQVEDDETWQHFLSRLSHSNVLNFGVGNYGFDQALLTPHVGTYTRQCRLGMESAAVENLLRDLNAT